VKYGFSGDVIEQLDASAGEMLDAPARGGLGRTLAIFNSAMHESAAEGRAETHDSPG
jgi:hypothetical protein